MSFFAIVLALLLEQARPLGRGNPVHVGLRLWVRAVLRNFDAGRSQGALVWVLAVGLPTLAAFALHWILLLTLGWVAAAVWSVIILYATLGFRQFSHHFTEIRDALDEGDEEKARQLLAQWRRMDAHALSRADILRHVIEQSVLAAHRHVFGVLAWFSIAAALGLGPAGAVFYRLSEFVSRYWPYLDASQRQPVSPAVRDWCARAWQWVDWLPARITAMGFAVVGSFEDAIESWRHYEGHHAELDPAHTVAHNDGLILAATAGALNLQLGDAVVSPVSSAQEPVPSHLRGVVGLVWRSVVMWVILLALLSVARLLG